MRKIPASAAQDEGFRFSIPAPVGGWNARDNISAMSDRDALVLDNLWPSATDVSPRTGSITRATLPGGQVIQSLLGLSLQTGGFKRFAGTATGIWNITAGGVIGAVESAATTGKWEYTQINVAGISYLFACAGDGVNDCRIYNGTTGLWTVLNGASAPALTGITSNLAANVSQFKNRLILLERDSMKFWYGPLNSVAGAFTSFDLGSVFKKGGYLVAAINWSLDAGQGLDDYFVVITSEGETAIYKGTDPSALATFALVGVYEVGKPTGKRCLFKLAADVGILTEQGLWPISKALLSSTVNKSVALTDKIQQAFGYFYSLYSSQYGWQAVLLPKGPAILVNVPISGTQSYQCVMNTITGAWCRFLDMNASCMMVLDGKLYFAIGNVVKEGWQAAIVDDAAAITCSVATAFTYGPTKVRGKMIKMAKPVIQASSPLTLSMALDTDFQQRSALQTQTSTGNTGTGWDTALWDTALWGDSTVAVNKWKKVRHKPGGAFSLRMRFQPKNITASWASTDFLGEVAGLAT